MNPVLLHVSGNGTLLTTDRTGEGTAVGSGALRYLEGQWAGSQAFYVEEATTNLLPNPSAEVDLASIYVNSTASVTNTRVSTYAVSGGWSVETIASGSTSSEGIAYRSSAGIGTVSARAFIGSVFARGAGTMTAYLVVRYADGSSVNGSSASGTMTSEWQRFVTPAITTDATKTLDYVQLWFRTDGAQAITFYTDAAQIEEKAYATSYTDGSLGTGYTWTGTAHNSSSTRDTTSVTDHNSGHIPTQRGSFAMWVRWADEPGRATIQSAIEALSQVGGTNSRIYLRRAPGSQKADAYIGNLDSYIQESGTSPANEWTLYVLDWDGPVARFWKNTELIGTSTTDGITNLPTTITLGGTSTTCRPNSRLGPVMTFDRLLTVQEQTTLYESPYPWWRGSLDDTTQVITYRGGPKQLTRKMWRALSDNTRVEEITDQVTSAQITMNVDRTVPMTLSLDLIDPAVVNPYSDYLAPEVMITEIASGTSTTAQLGLYRAGMPSTTRYPGAATGTIEGEDMISRLVNAGTGRAPYNLGPGASYRAAIITQCTLSGVPRTQFPLDSRTVPTGKYHSWPPGTARCRIVFDLCLILGWHAPWSDSRGVVTTRAIQAPGTQAPARSYADGDGSDLTGEVQSDPMTTTLANHIVVTYDDMTTGTVLTAERKNTNPSSPASIPNIGERFRHEAMTEAADQAAVNAFADQLVELWGSVLMHVSLMTPLDPARGVWESADVAVHITRADGGISGRFRISGWTHDLSMGMTSVELRRHEQFGVVTQE